MIEENRIDALLEVSKININGTQQYNYNISRKENLEDYLDSHDLTIDIVRRIILNIQLAYDELEKYMIDDCHIWLSKESVYLEKSYDSFKVSLCYYPKNMGNVQEQFRSIMEHLLTVVPASDKELAKVVYEAYDICLKEDYTLSEILDCISDVCEVSEPPVEKINLREEERTECDYIEQDYFNQQGEYISDQFDEISQEKTSLFWQVQGAVKNFLCKKIEFKDNPILESDDFVIDPENIELEQKTELLADVKPSGKLVYDGLNREEDFLVDKDVFRIGSGRANDAVLHERTVSTNHAKIVREGDDFYLSDLNSTNSTFVNNEQLVYRNPVKLRIMDRISFANVNYTFM